MLANWLALCGEAPAEGLVHRTRVRTSRTRSAQLPPPPPPPPPLDAKLSVIELPRLGTPVRGRALRDDRVRVFCPLFLNVGALPRPPVQPSVRRLGSRRPRTCRGGRAWRIGCPWRSESAPWRPGIPCPAGDSCPPPDRPARGRPFRPAPTSGNRRVRIWQSDLRFGFLQSGEASLSARCRLTTVISSVIAEVWLAGGRVPDDLALRLRGQRRTDGCTLSKPASLSLRSASARSACATSGISRCSGPTTR